MPGTRTVGTVGVFGSGIAALLSFQAHCAISRNVGWVDIFLIVMANFQLDP